MVLGFFFFKVDVAPIARVESVEKIYAVGSECTMDDKGSEVPP
jgi:hypothetical protein